LAETNINRWDLISPRREKGKTISYRPTLYQFSERRAKQKHFSGKCGRTEPQIPVWYLKVKFLSKK
jgi:hypothetical protein